MMAGGLPMKKRKGPGRPRKYPRLEGDAHSSQDVNSESEGLSKTAILKSNAFAVVLRIFFLKLDF